MEQTEDKKPINEGAEYICLNRNGYNTLVDMRDIIDIMHVQDIQMISGGKEFKIYNVIFTDHTFWQMPIEDEILEVYKNFKNKVDKEK